MQRLTRAAEIARENVIERDVADHARAAGVALEVASAEREVDVGEMRAKARRPSTPSSRAGTCRRSRRRRRPSPSRRRAARRTRGRRPRRRPPLGAHRARAAVRARLRSSTTIRSYSRRVGVVVPVEAGVHAAELRQAHRHVAVVEDDGDAEPLAQRGGMPRRCAIGTVKTTTASGRSRSTSRSRCLRQRGVTQRQITSRVILSPSPSSGLSSARRRWLSPFRRATVSRANANDSPSR